MEKEDDVIALIGMDWADENHAIELYDVAANNLEKAVVQQTPEALHEWVSALRSRFKKGKIAIALEQSRGTLIYALMRYEFLLLYPLNPKSLSSYRVALRTSGAKDDPSDAELILNFLRTHRDRLRVWIPEDKITRQLTLLVEFRRKIVADIIKVTNRLTSLLKTYYPQALEMAGQLDSRMACDFLRKWPSIDKLKKAQPAKLRKFYTQHNSRAVQTIENRILLAQTAEPLTEDSAIIKAGSLLAVLLVRQLQPLLENRSDIDAEIEKVFSLHPDREIYESLPGAGSVLEPRLAASMGTNRDKYETASELQQFIGTAPVTVRSGKTDRVHRRLARPIFVMQTHVEFAAQSIHYCAWADAFYHLQKQNGSGHHAAVRALAYKWDRILFRCWKERKPYDEARYLKSLLRSNSPLAKILNLQRNVDAAAPRPRPAQQHTTNTPGINRSSWATAGEVITQLKQRLADNFVENTKMESRKSRKKA